MLLNRENAYASLFAAMCRSQGIPARVEVGRIATGQLHAWNSVWLTSAGSVKGVTLKANSWTRLDITFMDQGGEAVAAFFQNDNNYTLQYCG